MSALGIAFDITIVGALALSWVMLIVDLFFTHREQRIKHVLESAEKSVSAPVLGVVLFAMAYFLGTAVTRTAQDSLNDDDLWQYLRIPRWNTEDDIRANTYCGSSEKLLGFKIKGIPDGLQQVETLCGESKNERSKRSSNSLRIDDIFGLQENALLLNGEDKTARLHQLRDQTIVLRGAAFNGFIAFWLSLFGLCARYAKEAGWVLSFLLFAAGVLSFVSHLRSAPAEPPLMEFTLFALAAAGVLALRKGTTRNYSVACVISFLATLMAYWSWQATEVLYNDRVISSFYALSHSLDR